MIDDNPRFGVKTEVYGGPRRKQRQKGQETNEGYKQAKYVRIEGTSLKLSHSESAPD